MKLVPCMGCGACFPEMEGPVHRYIQSTPGCWDVYGRVLSREYTPQGPTRLHRLTVDAYAVQHPGVSSPQSISSVAAHLISLCLVLERGVAPDRATKAIGAAVKDKSRFHWLAPQPAGYDVTVADVDRAADMAEHDRLVLAWAEASWKAWAAHHDQIRSWIPAGF